MRFVILAFDRRMALRVAYRILDERSDSIKTDRHAPKYFCIMTDGGDFIEWIYPYSGAERGIKADKVFADMNVGESYIFSSIFPMVQQDIGSIVFFYDKQYYSKVGADVFGV